jgi:uncharacterized protein YaiL (DUF2058 family)
MSNSLQDQLMKAGLVSKQDAKAARSEKRKKQKQKKKKGTVVVTDLDKQVEQAKLEKIEKDKALNKDLKVQAARKADMAKVIQMIKQHGLKDGMGELVFNFTFGSTVKKLFVDERTRDALISGRLGICVLGEEFFMLADETVRRLSVIDENVVAYMYDRNAEEAEPEMAEDDPYADYQIPDDLMW